MMDVCRTRSFFLRLLAPLLAAALPACRVGYLELGENLAKDAAANPGGDAESATPTGSTGELDAGSLSRDANVTRSFCQGMGPAVPLPILGECTGDIAKKTFRFAVCSCTNINLQGNLTTDALRSTTGAPSTTAASVGVDGTYSSSSADTRIGGSLWTNADTAMSGHTINGQLQCGGNLVVDGTSRVGADAYVAGGVQGGLAVGGTLHIGAGQPHTQVAAAGGVVEETVSVPPPCNCERAIDIAAIVDELARSNDNGAVGLDAQALATGENEAEITLPCGRYFLTEINGSAPLTVRVTGRVALGIGKSLIHNLGAVSFVVDSGAELDVFVAGDVLFSGPVRIGDAKHPSATRLYVGGAFGYDGTLELAANLYLPNGAFTTTTPRTEMWGSLFAKNVGVTGELIVHYDPSVLDVDGCVPPDNHCGSCNDCANPSPACKNGTCGKCETDSDCCAPLRCDAGACVPDLI